MIDLKQVEELTKALQDGKTLVCIDDPRYTCKNIDGYLVEYLKGEPHCFNASIILNNFQIQEPEPEFKITENQLAEYECRDGSKAVCYGVRDEDSMLPFRIINDNGENNLADIDGKIRFYDKEEEPKDLIRKIRDLT